MEPNEPFNPLDKMNLAMSIDSALCRVEPKQLDGLQVFSGAGIYALYYVGDFHCYKPMSEVNRKAVIAPIYVGKAEASGKRKGGFLNSSAAGTALFKRLSDHAKSIFQVDNLSIDDFLCRYLVVDETWIALGEAMLISKYAPVWNACVDGFGNHNPGKGRGKGARPKWDMLHPGRPWANRLPENQASLSEIVNRVNVYLTDERPPSRLIEQSRYEYGFIPFDDMTK